jgi:hypothetical protein
MEDTRPQEKIDAACRLLKSAILDGADADDAAEQASNAIGWALDELESE